MEWEAGIPAGFNERTTGFPEGHQIDLYAAGWRVQCRHPEGTPTPPAPKAMKMGALSVSCAL